MYASAPFASPLRQPRIARAFVVAISVLLLIAALIICAVVGGLGSAAARVFMRALAWSSLLSVLPLLVLWYLDRRERESGWLFAAARSVSGVTKVLDGLVVIKKDRSAGQAIDDTVIQSTLKSKGAAEDASKAWSINTEVYNGQVLMTGFIHGSKARARASEIAQSIKGVKKVYNKIELE